MPDVVPFLTYEDGIAALEWLAEVFGFTETARFTSSDGRLSHGEMSIGNGVIMLASPSADYERAQATSWQLRDCRLLVRSALDH